MWHQGILMGNWPYNEISNNYVDAVGGQLAAKRQRKVYRATALP